MSVPVLRFAPSPTGDLHLGGALSALLGFDAASRLGARFLVRIEDIDRARCRPGFESGILADLAWLGVHWEEPVRRQSRHLADYGKAAAQLASMGLLYPCGCSRADIARAVAARKSTGRPWPRDPDGSPIYPGTCRPAQPVAVGSMPAGAAALRLDMARATGSAGSSLTWTEHGDGFYAVDFDADAPGERVVADPARWGDVVLVRKDTPTSYHLSVVVDDAIQAVTHVTRGRDLFEATAIHRLLQVLLGLPEPDYAHHRLLVGPDGLKLSKSRHDTGIGPLRAAGATPGDIRVLAGLPLLETG